MFIHDDEEDDDDEPMSESERRASLKEWYCGDPDATDAELEEAMNCDDKID